MSKKKVSKKSNKKLDNVIRKTLVNRDPHITETRLNKILQAFRVLKSSNAACSAWHFRQVLELMNGDKDFQGLSATSTAYLFMRLAREGVLERRKSGLYALLRDDYVFTQAERKRICPVYLQNAEYEKLTNRFGDKKTITNFLVETVSNAIRTL